MNLVSGKPALVVMGLTAILTSRLMFYFFDDPEGPNLLIVLVMSAVVFSISFAAYRYMPVRSDSTKLLLAVLLQIVLVTGLYFVLR